MTYPFDAVIRTTEATGTPHLDALRTANPGLEIRVDFGPQSTDPAETITLWRNNDRTIRTWWQANRDATTAESILFLEWDVFCNADLGPLMLPPAPGFGLAAARIMTAVRDARTFRPFTEIGRLPRSMHAYGCQPLGLALISRAALEAILDPSYDAVFAADIFCELRLPSVISAAGYFLQEIHLPNVGVKPITPPAGQTGIWHPVKNPVP